MTVAIGQHGGEPVELLTPADVARRCQVSTKTVLRAIHRGRLRASRLGARGAYRIRVGDVEAWIAASAIAPCGRPVAANGPAAPVAASLLPRVAAGGRLVVTEQMGRR